MFVAASVLVSLGACSKNEESGKIEDESVKETVVSDSSEKIEVGQVKLKDDGYFKDIVTDGIDPEIKSEVSYKTDYENSDWDDTKFVIDHVKLVNVDKYKDNNDDKFSTLLSVKYKMYNEDSTDKSIKPDKAYLILNDGEKVEALVFMDYWDDEILTHDKHKDGYLYFKIRKEQKLEEVKSLEINFKAADEKNHTFNVDLPIEPEQ
ncbi:hypothetical protein ACQ3MN_07890 [Enterococcus faecalis]|uniref:hypothetical protein n=1 Tax=Enterococcus faecalis TaxID=1351 RepID=UPI003D7762B7